MKLLIITLNLLAAAAFVFLGMLANAIHSTHSYSTYHEFVIVGAISEKQLETIEDPENPGSYGYDLLARIVQAGNVETWVRRISTLAAAACVLNAVAAAAGVLMPGQNQTTRGSLSELTSAD
ncbi:hypothetical protein NG895_16535 [Aeoliella sp. ICT_H6.2]|uniref:Uncharacterized protein n=1 Tax=Aeoliella straminimaris TaxID=2954799 RepID=A0A9X2JGZ3_9BACT|nr:hypothetical protein [Aeoliella straminimaris]MCO6045520.1 hypothetical protein [Aeoliella straminimaris]